MTTVDGMRHLCAYVGPVELHFENRGCYTGALVLGDEVLLGAVPMEDLDLVISPSSCAVTVNPQSPNIPSSVAKHELAPTKIRLQVIPSSLCPFVP